MIKKLCTWITNILVSDNQITQDEVPCYVYCLEYLFENLLFVSFTLILSSLCKHTLMGILFLLVLISLRGTAGGIHAPTQFLCTLFSYGIIFLLSPVDTENKRFTVEDKKRLKHQCNIILLLLTVLFSIFFGLNMILYYGILTITSLIVASSVLLGAIKNWRSINYEA